MAERQVIPFHCESCSYCSTSRREFSHHTFETHSNEPNFKVSTIDGCCQTFQRYKSFSSHILRKHRRENLYGDTSLIQS